jgi:hypothetical protein
MKKRFWHLIFISFIFPIIGGIIVYFLEKEKDKELADFCLLTSFANPLLIGFLLGIVLSLLSIDMLIIQLLTVVVGVVLSWGLIEKGFPKNNYKYLVTILWFGLFGALYSYFYIYKNDKIVRNNILWLFLLLFILSAILNIILV